MLKNFLSKKPDLNGKSILITGGTGSFGNCFADVVSKMYKPKKLIIFSRDELKQYEMEQRFPIKKYPFIRFFIGDVRDLARLEMAFRDVDIVIHAAALKHVPIAEYNPFECINTNVIGAENVVRAALKTNVKKVIALSTDKAVSPINLYGASKLAAEKIFVAANNIKGNHPAIFSVVRYGNVMGSRGSVVPFFKRLIAENSPFLPITDMEMTRFWITLNQGVDFVLSSLAMMKGCEIFIPKIPSMRVTDLAKALSPSMPLKETGIRPGEKLHESLSTTDESIQSIELKDRYVIYSANDPHFIKLAKKSVSKRPRFTYSSDTNTEWLNEKDLKSMMGSMHA
jgi:UDP-N-acetylglucosamine 4,6-dehydratase